VSQVDLKLLLGWYKYLRCCLSCLGSLFSGSCGLFGLGGILASCGRSAFNGGAGLGSLATFFGLLGFSLLLFSLGLKECSGSFLVIGHEIDATHVWSQNFRNDDTFISLVVLEDAAHGAGRCAHGSVQHVNINLLVSVLQSISGLEGSGLVISAVRARNELSESVIAWEPSFKIVLHGSSVVKFPGHNVDNLVGKSKSLVKSFRGLDHSVELIPGFAWVAVDELLNLFELMDSEDTPDISSVGASFFAEAGGNTSISERKVSGLDPLLHVEGRDWLLRGCDEIKWLIVVSSFNLVKVLGEVRELASLLHDGFFHEEGGLDLSVVTLSQLGHTVGDEGLVKLHAQAFQVVAAMTSDARSTFHLEHVKASHDLVMTKLSKLASISLEAAVGFAPSAHNFVICLILGNGDVRVDDVANLSKQLLGLRCDFLCLLFLLLD